MRRLYGAGPLHLLVLLGSFALAAAAALRVADDPLRLRYLAWFLGVVLVHDLLLLPLYVGLDRSMLRPLRASNHVRVPLLLSGLLLLMFAPVVFQRSEPAYGAASGLDQDPYLARWLLVSGLLFLGSAAVYLLRRRSAARA